MTDDEQLLAVNEALDGFAAQALGISEPTARRWWSCARAWLNRSLTPPA